jgi:adenosylhomocysteine nucleosidase
MIGVIFATPQEAAPFLTQCDGQALGSTPITLYQGHLPAPCRSHLKVAIVGMGPHAAAAGLAWFLTHHPQHALVNAGICGALGDGACFRPGSLFVIREVASEPTADIGLPQPGPLPPGPWDWLPRARLVTVANPVFDARRRERLARLGELVDMEGGALLQVAQDAGQPMWMIKAVSDMAGPGDHAALHANLARIAEIIARTLVKGLSRLSRHDHDQPPGQSKHPSAGKRIHGIPIH